jgi:DNA-binding beta-propeller fold protein YncE
VNFSLIIEMIKMKWFFYILVYCYSGVCWAQQWQAVLLDSFPRSDSSVKISDAVAISVDLQNQIYIVDRANHQLLKFALSGKLLDQVGGFGKGAQTFDNPTDVFATAALDVFVADYNNQRVVRFDKNLNFISELVSQDVPPYDFGRVLSVVVSPQYDLFILEESQNRIIKFNRFSEAVGVMGGLDDPYAQLLAPTDLAIDRKLQIYVCDPAQKALVIFDYLGNFVTKITHPQFLAPKQVFIDWQDRIFVTDTERNEIFMFDPNRKFIGVITVPATMDKLRGCVGLPTAEKQPLRLILLSAGQYYLSEITGFMHNK